MMSLCCEPENASSKRQILQSLTLSLDEEVQNTL